MEYRDPYLTESGVLINSVGVTDPADLSELIDVFVPTHSRRLTEVDMTPDGLRDIHEGLFGEIYSWAGDFRTTAMPFEDSTEIGPRVAARIEAKLESLFCEVWEAEAPETSAEFSAAATALAVTLADVAPFRDGSVEAAVAMTGQWARSVGVPMFEFREPEFITYRDALKSHLFERDAQSLEFAMQFMSATQDLNLPPLDTAPGRFHLPGAMLDSVFDDLHSTDHAVTSNQNRSDRLRSLLGDKSLDRETLNETLRETDALVGELMDLQWSHRELLSKDLTSRAAAILEADGMPAYIPKELANHEGKQQWIKAVGSIEQHRARFGIDDPVIALGDRAKEHSMRHRSQKEVTAIVDKAVSRLGPAHGFFGR